MRQIETTFQTFGASMLLIGLKGENNAAEILIDCAESLEEYQGTMAAMSITGPDGTVYPGDISLDEDGIVHWVVSARDCSIEGHGSARVDLVDDDGTVVASAEATTIIIKTNMQNIEPDQIAEWTDAASVALQEVRAALQDMIDNNLLAEAFAKGTVNGVDVEEGNPGYNDNAKHYKELAASAAAEAGNSATNAATSASNAAQSASNAGTLADTSEAYAKGTVDGAAVQQGETGYHDNAKYYKVQADQARAEARIAGAYDSATYHTENGTPIAAIPQEVGHTDASGSSVTHKDNAKGWANEAKHEAELAKGYATNARSSATAAATSESNAATSKTNAANSATDAAGSATAAAGSAAQAAGSATAAAGSAASAGASETAAASSATAAAGSATAAAGSAAQAAATVAGIEAAGAAQVAAVEDKGEEVLDSIPADYTALSNKVSDLNSAIDLSDLTQIPFTISAQGKFIAHATGVETSSSGGVANATGYIDVSSFSIIRYRNYGSTSSSIKSGMAFYDENKNYIEGYMGATGMSAAGYYPALIERTVPDGAVYARFTVYADTETYGNFALYGRSLLSEKVRQMECATDISKLSSEQEIPIIFTGSGGVLASTGGINSSSLLCATDYVDLTGFETIRYKRIDSTSSTPIVTGMAFYNSEKEYVSGIRSNYGAEAYTWEYYETEIPDGAKYARFSWYKDNTTYGSFALYGTSKLHNLITGLDSYIRKEATAMGMHTIPDSIGRLNVIRRARQITDVKWIPKANLKRLTILTSDTYDDHSLGSISARYQDVFNANQEYTGIPYTDISAGSEYQYNVTYGNIDAMISALENAGTNAENDVFNATGNKGPRFGGTCIDLVMYAYDMQRGHLNAFGSAFTKNTESDDTFVINPTTGDKIDPEYIEVGDHLRKPGDHSALITDIIRDSDDEIIAIEVSELTKFGNLTGEQGTDFGGKARRVAWPLNDFYEWFSGFWVVKPKDSIINTVSYTPCKAVPVGTEGKPYIHRTLPIVPANGDYCVLARGANNELGNTVTLVVESLYPLPGNANLVYNKIKITDPDGTETEYDISGNTLDVTVNKSGEWKAQLLAYDGGNVLQKVSRSCHWYAILLLSESMTVNGNNFEIVVTHSDADCEPVSAVFASFGGTPFRLIENIDIQSTVSGGIKTWTITGVKPSVAATSYFHMSMKTPYGVGKCVSDETF